MIIDQIRLSGEQAYLRDGDRIDLTNPIATGSTEPIGEGMILEVTGIDILLESEKLLDLYRRRPSQLLSVEVKKEMFPGLFADPYQHRVHTVGGFEDFKRGKLVNIRAMEVDGVPTLVSVGTDLCQWTSGIYRMPKPITLVAAAWDAAISRLTAEQAFQYTLIIVCWTQEPFDDGSAQTITLTNKPDDKFSTKDGRFREGFAVDGVIAYQVFFEAEVQHDTFLHERHVGSQEIDSLGVPLLQAVHVLEQTPPAYHFHSLQELILNSADYELFNDQLMPPKRLAANLNISATLTENESITLTVHEDVFQYVEARLEATVLWRPPTSVKVS